MSELVAVAIGILGGAVGGLLGVGGGVLFVPALSLALGLSQIEAVASSLVAIIPVAIVGTIRQHRYGNVVLRDGLLVGLLSVPGVVVGAAIANSLPNRVLEIAFGLLMFFVAATLVRKALRKPAT